MIDVIDDLFDERYLHNFFPIVTDKIPLTAGNTANREGFPYGDTSTHRLFGSQIFQRENLNRTTSNSIKNKERILSRLHFS